ncbi:MAG: hypothetical protein P8076_07810 [Gammaproteobacteria bacterium]
MAASDRLTAPVDQIGLAGERFALRLVLVLVLATAPKIQPLRRMPAGGRRRHAWRASPGR